jgi:hypothetical protein
MDDEKQKTKGPVPYTLSEPITLGEKTWTDVTIRRPSMGDLEASDAVGNKAGSEMSSAIELAARLTGMPPKAIRAMDPDDFLAIDEVIKGFSKRSRETGDNSPSS